LPGLNFGLAKPPHNWTTFETYVIRRQIKLNNVFHRCSIIHAYLFYLNSFILLFFQSIIYEIIIGWHTMQHRNWFEFTQMFVVNMVGWKIKSSSSFKQEYLVFKFLWIGLCPFHLQQLFPIWKKLMQCPTWLANFISFYLYPKSRNEKELSNWRNNNLLLESNLGSKLLHIINDNETIF
jgi:hypothetical protein